MNVHTVVRKGEGVSVDRYEGYQFESLDDSHHLWLRQPLGSRWALRYDRDLTHTENEVGLQYRVDDYVGLEYVVSDHDHWLRIIGYL